MATSPIEVSSDDSVDRRSHVTHKRSGPLSPGRFHVSAALILDGRTGCTVSVLSAAGVSRQAVEQVAGLFSTAGRRIVKTVQHLGKAYGGVRVRGSEAQAGLVDLQGGAEFDTVYLY